MACSPDGLFLLTTLLFCSWVAVAADVVHPVEDADDVYMMSDSVMQDYELRGVAEDENKAKVKGELATSSTTSTQPPPVTNATTTNTPKTSSTTASTPKSKTPPDVKPPTPSPASTPTTTTEQPSPETRTGTTEGKDHPPMEMTGIVILALLISLILFNFVALVYRMTTEAFEWDFE